MDWNNILTFFISAGAITGAIVYIGKRIVDKSLDLALEKYKSTLALELETHKIQLEKALFEHQTKFGKLHQDRLDVIKLLHTKLYELQMALVEIVDEEVVGGDPMTQFFRGKPKKSTINERLIDLKDSLEIYGIFFSDEICKKIGHILYRSQDMFFQYVLVKGRHLKTLEEVKNHPDNPENENVLKIDAEMNDTWRTIALEILEDIPPTRRDLTLEFRKLIGVE
jgi:hypothetical protein